jgi:tetratricopeptide (TPR) repeat protein
MFRSLICALALVAAPSLALAQDDLNEAFKNLKAADEQKDNDAVKKWAVDSLQMTAKILSSPQPTSESDAAVWKTTQSFAKDVKQFAEYALDAAILRTPEPEKKIELFQILEKASPDSKYLQQLYTPALAAQAKMKPDRSFEFAQHVVGKDPNNEEALLVLTAGCYERKQYDATVNYGGRLAKVMTSHPKPEGVSGTEWENKRTVMLGRAHWLSGMAYEAQGKHPQASESLKASLPFLKGEPQLLAQAQFYIGVSDYNLARVTHDRGLMQEALKYSQMAAESSTAVGKQASQNAYAIKQELARMR